VKNERNTEYAPLKSWVLAAAVAVILLAAAAVCVLHGINAVSLRGMADPDAYVQLEDSLQRLTLPIENGGKARSYAVYVDGEKQFALHMAAPKLERGIVHIEGTLLRPEQTVGEIRVRVGLMAQKTENAIVLNTQMVRRHEAGENGYDDHCGFSAAVRETELTHDAYQVVLVDETGGAKRMIHTGVSIRISEDGGLQVNTAESGEQHAQ